MNRRQFLTSTSALGALSASAAVPGVLRGKSAGDHAATLKPGRITLEGKLVHECSQPGEKRADGVYPAHPNGIRLSKDRVLLLYATRGWRGVDEDRSIIYQVRLGGFTGPILKEGMLVQSRDDWDPFDDGSSYYQAHGTPSGFGVPKGALIDGRPAPHANLFVIKWYVNARYFLTPDRLALTTSDPKSVHLSENTIHMEWVQVRLNEAEDDIEIVEPISTMRTPDQGEGGLRPTERFTQSKVQAMPFNHDATEWIDTANIDWSEKPKEDAIGLVPAKFRYDHSRHRYEFSETGSRLYPAGVHLSGGSPLKIDQGWAFYSRPHRSLNLPLVWTKREDPFSDENQQLLMEPRTGQPIVRAPVTAYRCADGVIRVFTGDSDESPYQNRRNPLYCWEVDPQKDFKLSRQQVVVDVLEEDWGFRLESEPIADMAKVLPHCGGRSQYVAFRVRSESINYSRKRHFVPVGNPRHISPAITDEERMASGIYVARIDYDREMPDEWQFA